MDFLQSFTQSYQMSPQLSAQIILQWIENVCPHKNLDMSMCSSLAHNFPNPEAAVMASR